MIMVSFVMLTRWSLESTEGWEQAACGANLVIRGCNFQSHPFALRAGKSHSRLSSIAPGQWVIQSGLCTEASINPQGQGSGSFPVGEHTEIWGEWAPCFLPIPRPIHVFYLAVCSVLSFYNTLVNLVNRIFLWVLWVTWAN